VAELGLDGLIHVVKSPNGDGTTNITGSDVPIQAAGGGGSGGGGGAGTGGHVTAGDHDALFVSKAPGLMQQLIDDFGFAVFQAAGVLGNIGHECNGFHDFQEINPIGGGAGGLGWAQWTGPRRTAFVNFCQTHGLSTGSDDGNYGFLKEELNSTEKSAVPATRGATTIGDAVRQFEAHFERADPNHKGFPSRDRWAALALAAYQATHP
jgi:hypothetical protein